MKKIMFNDRYGLTQAVLEGRKTMTRRVIPAKIANYVDWKEFDNGNSRCWLADTIDERYFDITMAASYKVGEVVAVAQAYSDIRPLLSANADINPSCAGWSNKMIVRADLMPRQIKITDIKVERLQDISDEDCLKEGFSKEVVNNGWGNAAFHWEAMLLYEDNLGRTKTIQSRNPKEAFSFLIDHICGRGTWEKNPYVFAYEFELVK